MTNGSCSIPAPEEQRFLAIQKAAERAMLEKVSQAISDASAEVARNVRHAGLEFEPTSEGYFTFAVQQVCFVHLCGGDPDTLQGGNPEIGEHIIRNCRSIIDSYWQGGPTGKVKTSQGAHPNPKRANRRADTRQGPDDER